MKLSLFTILLLTCSLLSFSFEISRGKFLRNNFINFILNKNDFINNNYINYNNYNNHNAFIISCNNIGKQIAKEFKEINLKTTITTTKPKRIEELSKLANNIVLIPQMEITNDEIMRNEINNNDIIILADTISIFSIHTFIRTCQRIVNAIINYKKENNKENKKTIILISSINVYGIHTDGEIINENYGVKSYDNKYQNKYQNNNQNNYWQLNHIAIAKLIRTGENLLLDLMNNYPNNNIRTVILRTSSIIDKDIINKIKKRDFKLTNYTKEIGNSYMSISLTEEISNCIKWIIDNEDIKGVFNLVSKSYKRKYFYDKLFDIIKKEKINWINDKTNPINTDYYFSMDENPLLVNCQRFNMIVDNDYLIKKGYKFKYKNIWNYDFRI